MATNYLRLTKLFGEVVVKKQIKDIRLYESDWANVDGQPHPGDFGRLFANNFNSNFLRIGYQFALKLREFDFRFKDFDHLYINLTTELSDGVVQVSERSVDNYHSWFRYVDYGLNKQKYEAYSEDEINQRSVDIISNCLKELVTDANEHDVINKVSSLILQRQENLEIKYKEKVDKENKVQLFVSIFNTLEIETSLVYSVNGNGKRVKLDIDNLVEPMSSN